MVKLGNTCTDKISGFSGVAIGRVEYISGCNQVLLQPRGGGDKIPDSVWLDEQRLVEDKAWETVVLVNGDTPGFDKAPPRR